MKNPSDQVIAFYTNLAKKTRSTMSILYHHTPNSDLRIEKSEQNTTRIITSTYRRATL